MVVFSYQGERMNKELVIGMILYSHLVFTIGLALIWSDLKDYVEEMEWFS